MQEFGISDLGPGMQDASYAWNVQKSINERETGQRGVADQIKDGINGFASFGWPIIKQVTKQKYVDPVINSAKAWPLAKYLLFKTPGHVRKALLGGPAPAVNSASTFVQLRDNPKHTANVRDFFLGCIKVQRLV